MLRAEFGASISTPRTPSAVAISKPRSVSVSLALAGTSTAAVADPLDGAMTVSRIAEGLG